MLAPLGKYIAGLRGLLRGQLFVTGNRPPSLGILEGCESFSIGDNDG